MKPVTDSFGSLVFDERAMKEALPKETYDALRETAAFYNSNFDYPYPKVMY